MRAHGEYYHAYFIINSLAISGTMADGDMLQLRFRLCNFVHLTLGPGQGYCEYGPGQGYC